MKSLDPNQRRLGTDHHADHGRPAAVKLSFTAVRWASTGRIPCDPANPSICDQSERKAKTKIKPMRRGKTYPEMR